MPRTRTFTFLFTDIEGSTSLLSRLGADAYGAVLADHHRLVREGLARHGGTERDTQGDAFFVTFESPSACLDAAIDIQRALAGHTWDGGGALRVRMGVHAGEASETQTGLIGVDVHRAARIAGVAHGGQIVLSEPAAAFVRDGLPGGTTLRNLGQHRLKDLDRPQLLFQVEADGLMTEFPPLRSLNNPELPNNLPFRSSSFVGRGTELSDVRGLVETSRVVTLAGAGGVGKTRLALEVAAQLLDANREGVFFVDLSEVAHHEDVPGAILSALGLEGSAGGSGLEGLLDVLETQQTLIVLDNCEHVVDACAKIAELLEARSTGVHVLATSREPLGVEGERVYRLGPLSLPPEDASSLADLADSDAVGLFVERARAGDVGFVPDDSVVPLLVSICRRLDGVPFALELAAARTGSMSLSDLNHRLDQRFALLTSGKRTALPRQRTLMATVDWSYDLLVDQEQVVLDQLSVFAGSFDLAAAESICAPVVGETVVAADVLSSLVDKSLVAAERTAGDVRYRLLETIRQYASDKLAARGGHGAVDEARSLHASYYLALAERAAPALHGGPEQGRWMKQVDLEWTNLRAAADHFDARSDSGSVLRLGVALYRWCTSKSSEDLIPVLRSALGQSDELDAAQRARGFLAAGWIRGVGYQSNAAVASVLEYVEAGLAIARGLGDAALLAEFLVLRSFCGYRLGEEGSVDYAREALSAAEKSGEPGLVALARMSRAQTGDGSGVTAIQDRMETLRYFQEAGDLQGAAGQYSDLSGQFLIAGDVARALEYAREAAHLNRELGGALDFDGNLSVCELLSGNVDEAARAARVSLVASRRKGHPTGVINAFAVWVLACCAARSGDHERATVLTAAHDVLDAHLAEVAANSFRWTPLEQRERDDNRRRLKEALGEQRFGEVYERGRGLSAERALDLALGRTGQLT